MRFTEIFPYHMLNIESETISSITKTFFFLSHKEDFFYITYCVLFKFTWLTKQKCIFFIVFYVANVFCI